MNYTGSHTNDIEDDGDVTAPFDHVTYASFRYVDPSEVTATVERNVLDGSVDPDAIVPTHSSIRAAKPAPAPVETPALPPVVPAAEVAAAAVVEEEEMAADDLVIDDSLIEMASLATRSESEARSSIVPASRPSAPPPLPARASRASLPPPSRPSEPPPTMASVASPVEVAVPPGLFAIEIVSLPAPSPVASPIPAPVIEVSPLPLAAPPPALPPIEVAPVFVQPAQAAAPTAQLAPPFPAPAKAPAFPMMAAPHPSAFPPPSFPFNDTPSTAPVAMSLSAGLTGGYEAMTRRRVRLSPAALAALIVLVGSSVLAFGSVLALRFSRHVAMQETASTDSTSREAAPAAEAPFAPVPVEPAATTTQPAVPTIAPAALPSVVASVAVESLPKIAVDPAMTLVSTPASAKGHRVFVDGRVVGTAGRTLQVKCGDHSVKVGSAGKARPMHFPCGGEVSVD